MKNKYIFFRTDRIGDFLLSAILIKSIKRSDKNSFITVVASKKNFEYIRNIDFIDEVIQFPNNYLYKFFFYLKFFLKKFYLVGILDGKKRSIYFSFFVRSKFKILFTYKRIYKKKLNYFFSDIFLDKNCNDKISEILKLLNIIGLNFLNTDLNTINKDLVLKRSFTFPAQKKFTLLHLDEKWIFKDYIKTYQSIEPDNEEKFFLFLEKIISKSNTDLFISSGFIDNKFTYFLKNKFSQISDNIYEFKVSNFKILFFDNLSFFELEKLILCSECLITCHGAPSHVAASFNTKLIDIIDTSERIFFKKWTAHFRTYFPIYRINFDKLSTQIIGELKFKE